MELKLEDIKATIIRLQGQMDVWQNLYQAIEQQQKEGKKETHDTAAKS